MLDLADLKAKLGAMTEGKWEALDGDLYAANTLVADFILLSNNALGIVALVNAASELIAEVDRLRKVETAAKVIAARHHQHLLTCPRNDRGWAFECDCGLDALRAALSEGE